MDTRLDLHLHARRRRGTSARAGAVAAAGMAVAAVILAGVLVLIVDGHDVSWLAGLLAGSAAAAGLSLGRARLGTRAAGGGAGAQRRTELAVRPLEQAGWSFVHGVPGPDGPFDHIAVGPGGLILLESMSPEGVVRMIGGEPVVERAAEAEMPPRVERLRPTALVDATALRDRVQRIAARRVWVQAVVIFWSEFPAGCVADGRCVYIHGSRLAEWMSRRPHQFDEAEAREVAGAVRELAARSSHLDRSVAV
jgi:hypothetical protein